MAASLHKLLKKPPFPSSLPLLRALVSPQLPHTSPPHPLPLLREPSCGAARTSPPPPNGEGSPPSSLLQPSLIFPTFPFAYVPEPLVRPPCCSGGLDWKKGDGEDDERTVWADSVKKKRKRKMNKHKLRKLRRMLRRKA